MAARQATDSVVRRLAWYFRRNGYVRYFDRARRAKDVARVYKKGDEVRLVAQSLQELAEIQQLLRAAGFVAGKPFAKARQYRQPVYGRLQVKRFLQLIGISPSSQAASRPIRTPPPARTNSTPKPTHLSTGIPRQPR